MPRGLRASLIITARVSPKVPMPEVSYGPLLCKPCKNCGTGFRTRFDNRAFCEPRCRARYKVKRHEVRNQGRPWEEWYGGRWRCPPAIQKLSGVYFVMDSGTGMVKIGFTKQKLISRLKSLQNGAPHSLVVLALVPNAGEKAERWLHDRFAEDRVPDSEWFQPTPRLLGFVHWICNTDKAAPGHTGMIDYILDNAA